jgi:hypothetical protein
MNADKFLSLKKGSFIHDPNSGDEWIVISVFNNLIEAKCTRATDKFFLGEIVEWNCVVSDYFIEGKFPNTSPWISCKDSLPNKGEYVFVRMNDNTHFVASLENNKFYDNVEGMDLQPTHWMHIPE